MPFRTHRHSPFSNYVLAALVVGAATGVSALIFRRTELTDIAMVYLLGILVVATRLGRGPSWVASILSVAAFDFIFVPPYLTFAVTNYRHVGTFSVMLLVGVVTGNLTERVRAQARLVEAERLRNALLSSVSHDLRTPLGIITGAISTALETQDLPEATRRELLGTAQSEAQRLHLLVSNLLEITRLESGGLDLHREWVPLEEVIGAVLNRPEWGAEAARVRVRFPEAPPWASLDPVLMEQLLRNLLDNALKYSPAGSPVDLQAWVEGGRLVLALADQGPGLPVGQEAQVFEKFVRGPQAAPGAGLGLTICRGIVTAHGGHIEASTQPSGGARFLVSLPVGTPPQMPEAGA